MTDSAMESYINDVYEELRRLAHGFFQVERTDHTLQPTALVHEAYLRLAEVATDRFNDRSHFYRVAARAMRRALLDYARGKRRLKRGGERRRISLDGDIVFSQDRSEEWLALDEALEKLHAQQPRKAEIVEMRYFAGLSVQETADALESSPATVKREWAVARAWLMREIYGDEE